MTYHILFVEDEDAWLEVIERYTKRLSKSLFDCEIVKTAEAARAEMRNHHYHFVSVDQNLRDRAGEFVSSRYGEELCRHLVRYYPMTDRAIYTGYGEIPIAAKTGLLDGTPYLQKALTQDSESAGVLDAETYITVWIKNRLDHYHIWALERAGRFLPARLAERAVTIADEWKKTVGADWPQALRSLGTLVELTITLTWAQTAALVRAAQLDIPPHRFNTPREKLDALPVLFRSLTKARMDRPFKKAFGPQSVTRVIGAAGREALNKLLAFRNEDAHGGIDNPDRADLEKNKPDIILLLDALSLWAERPLISGLRYHPGERGRIQFLRHAGPSPERWDDMKDVFENLPSKSDHVTVIWERDDQPLLADLHPFVILQRNDQRRLEPFVLREYTRDTAIYWSLHGSQSRSFKPADAPDIHDAIKLLITTPDHSG